MQTLHTLLSDEKLHSRRKDVCHRHLLTLTVELRQSVPSLPKIVKSLPQNLAIAMSAWFRFVYFAARPCLSIAFSHAVAQQFMLQQTRLVMQVPRSEMQAALALRFGGDGIVKMKGLPFKATADDVIK